MNSGGGRVRQSRLTGGMFIRYRIGLSEADGASGEIQSEGVMEMPNDNEPARSGTVLGLDDVMRDLIPARRKNRPGVKMTPMYITIHDTANPARGADALAHAMYLKSDTAANLPVSWHFTADDKRIVQHLPLDEHGWHAGDGRNGPGNRSSIGIEICENADGDRAKAEANAAKLVADLLKRLNLPVDRVVQHNRWSGKNCPHLIRARAGGWEKFIAAVEAFGRPPETGSGTAGEPPRVGGAVRILVNGKDAGTGYIIGDRAYAPLRAIGEALGLEVGWDAETRTASLKGGMRDE